ncbi:MAG: tRNA 2-selenouridine(34) synthase MnmH [Deltaproteobacteria bacterium]|nr:MAG: tRNA 2-selenouridine(34) synthase MnmH [Deltaproteobacteria bacterium]
MQDALLQREILRESEMVVAYREALDSGYLLVDVRSAAEFHRGALPGAINIELFDSDERAHIGTIYKHGGQTRAIEQGFACVEAKLEGLLLDFEPYKNRTIAIYCARGGMRSRSVVNLLRLKGYSAFQIEGGYKSYRQEVLDFLAHFRPRLIVLHGYTGVGKTRIIQGLKESIDLEELAQHRSSLFGGLDRKPSTQCTFETRLHEAALAIGDEPFFVEGESRKIGRVYIPTAFARSMKEAVLVNIDCSLQTRIARIVEDYPIKDERQRGEIEAILLSLKQKLGRVLVEKMCDFLQKDQLNELVHILLVEYYDKRYAMSMRDYTFALQISSENIAEAITTLNHYRKTLMAAN